MIVSTKTMMDTTANVDVEEAGGLRGGGRRRQLWSIDRKRQIIAESFEPGASVADVARRHGVNANLLFTWRRQQGVAKLADSQEGPQLVPVTIAAERVSSVPAGTSEPAGRMEIVLGADRIIVGADVDATALARVIKALSRPGRTGSAER
jgi:transposase